MHFVKWLYNVFKINVFYDYICCFDLIVFTFLPYIGMLIVYLGAFVGVILRKTNNLYFDIKVNYSCGLFSHVVALA